MACVAAGTDVDPERKYCMTALQRRKQIELELHDCITTVQTV